MEQLHTEVAKLQAVGMRFLDVKQEVRPSIRPLLRHRLARLPAWCHVWLLTPGCAGFSPWTSPQPALQIARVVAAQKANREALAAAKSGGGGMDERWVQRPGGVWLRLPQEQAARVLRQGVHAQGVGCFGLAHRERAAATNFPLHTGASHQPLLALPPPSQPN